MLGDRIVPNVDDRRNLATIVVEQMGLKELIDYVYSDLLDKFADIETFRAYTRDYVGDK